MLKLTQIDRERWSRAAVFAISFAGCLIYLLKCGSMANASGDAADIWAAIKVFNTSQRHLSYVMYKGISSVYPYVWFYQLASSLRINEFFFVMLYHAVLFAYVVTYGVPALIQSLTDYRPKLWQRMLIAITLFWYWNRYRLIDQLMVDLPSCAFFLISVHCAVNISESKGTRLWALALATGLFAGMCANISGQYMVAAILVMIYEAVQLFGKNGRETATVSTRTGIVVLMCSIAVMQLPKLANILFNAKVIQPLIDAGGYLTPASFWFERALFRGLGINRQLYGETLVDPRGFAIITSIYGEEAAEQLWEASSAGTFGWSIPEYFRIVFLQPDDFVMIYLDTLISIISDDAGNGSLRILLPGYTMIYLALYTMVNRTKQWHAFLNKKTLLVLGALASSIPIFMGWIEMRHTISVQCLAFGTAILGPALPAIFAPLFARLRQDAKQSEAETVRKEAHSPWPFLGWILFCLFCLAFFGAVRGGSDLGVELLYHW